MSFVLIPSTRAGGGGGLIAEVRTFEVDAKLPPFNLWAREGVW